ncbi:transketolase [Desulfacinum hydrothermale DSM 13146]|uniref:Transketolase n=1 Tax=Desulfacinum hydrothermale DSM 13146 TaxID=1121390 RepID=A0A1W1XDX0_9BACT|nr:transketolase [Desulfacinum hydrothermale]SMC22235.1 transketolase [Desulfacinum hydrothermale DSM 13146]
MNGPAPTLDERCITTIRLLAVDMVEQAKSGHPGLPLGAAPMAYALWSRHLRHNPADPAWPNRDRFILSAGHGSALLYALLHLTGYDLSLDELKNFRQWGSKTPGHPEFGLTPGVECTTGPLGQGFAMGVGMAIAERWLAARFNRPDFPVIDHYTYALVSDGDLMEGVACEAASLAGHLKLGKLIYLYDDNRITIEGNTSLAFTEDVAKRFESYGWHIQRVEDGNDVEAVSRAIENAQAETQRPSLILVRTVIGYGSPKQDSPSCHGEPLGPDATRETKACFGWPADAAFHVPDDVRQSMGRAVEAGKREQEAWHKLLEGYRQAYPQEAALLDAYLSGTLPSGWTDALPDFDPAEGALATRAASGKVLNALAPVVTNLMGGSADLAPSNKTMIADGGDRNLHFGVREHAMGAILNGMALHGGVRPYGGTFLVFADYMRPAIRLAALMGTRVIYIFTHDSIGVGEDGPTHQPIEQLASLRVIPNLTVLRPADAKETAAAWKRALESDGPVALALTRQKVPVLSAPMDRIQQGVEKGAYVVAESDSAPRLILMATGSEVHLALAAREILETEKGVPTRVVSMPSWELFAAQPQAYRDSVLPPQIRARVAVEAGTSLGWHQWVGDAGAVMGIDRFGASAPGGEVMNRLGLTVENVVDTALRVLNA